MRFKTDVRNIQTFTKFTASLTSIGKVAWLRLDNDAVQFTIIPETGSQVWATLVIDSIFEDYTIQSAAENNTINLELPLGTLHRALKSALNASSASLRLTKKDDRPVLSLTIVTSSEPNPGTSANGFLDRSNNADPFDEDPYPEENLENTGRETIIVQDIPIRVLSVDSVENIHHPQVREAEVNVMLPSLIQLKAVSDRFTKLAAATGSANGAGAIGSARSPKLELSANMHGSLKLSIATDALNISTVWTGLINPDLDPSQVQNLEVHPTTVFKEAGPDKWATVRIDGRDWGRVLSVGRMGGRVIACFVDEHALILYVYLPSHDESSDESVLTYYITSYTL